jgi:flagellar FliJ protein
MPQRLPLDTLTDLARTQTDDAARRLGVLQSAQITAGQKLDLLLQYRQDYYDQLHALMNKGLPTAQWRNYQAFLGTLDGAIEQQRAIVAQAANRLDHGRVDWQHHKRRLNSFDTLAERVRRQEVLAQAKREQRDSDERSARKFFDRATHPTL